MSDCLISCTLSTLARDAVRIALQQKPESFDHLLYTTMAVALFAFGVAFALLFSFFRALGQESDATVPRSRKFIRLGALIAAIVVASIVFLVLSRR